MGVSDDKRINKSRALQNMNRSEILRGIKDVPYVCQGQTPVFLPDQTAGKVSNRSGNFHV
jgi:hypothetical protein